MNPKPKLSLIICIITLVLSLFIIIPMSLNLKDFKGLCLLYAQVNSSNVTEGVDFQWGNSSNCNFILYMGYSALVASLVLLWQTAVLVWKEYDRTPFSSFLVFCGTGIMTLTLLIASLLAIVGYSMWCDCFDDASMCENVDLTWLEDKFGVTTSHFYSHMMITQFGIWASLCMWFLALLISFCKVKHYHNHEDLLQNLAHEKEKLFSSNKRYARVHFEENPPTA
uniref:Transmembrane protein 179-like n=1 Tax=Phallusia mammillata TaxID=59560 RepID=A0A6F9DW10_9ASCI|nr:transmembrane protein 179-like [Phallusia mammillata]